jgi:hypothetical protein
MGNDPGGMAFVEEEMKDELFGILGPLGLVKGKTL